MIARAAAATGTAPVGGHLWHLLAGLAFFVLTMGGVALSERVSGGRRPRRDASPTGERPSAPLLVMAIAGLGAAAVHAVVMPDHFEEATIYGVFFAITATVQLGYSALLLWRPSRVLVAAGVCGNLAMVGLWLVTRTVEVPLGPGAGEVEPFGGLDLLASGFEIAIVVAGLAALLRVAVPSRIRMRSLLSPVIGAVVFATAMSVAVTAYVAPPA
jgi:hypothetical protein